MALDFSGTNQGITRATVSLSDTITVAGWFDADTQGVVDGGIIWHHDSGSDPNGRSQFAWDTVAGSKKLRFRQHRTVANGAWVMTNGFTTLTGWKFFAVTYDFSSAANDPILYIGSAGVLTIFTVGSGLTEQSTPNGTAAADGETFRVGLDEISDQDWDGRFAEYAAWTSILSANQISALFNDGMMAIPGQYFYWPMDDSTTCRDYSGNGRTGTVSGATAFTPGPPTRPAGRRG